MERRSFLAIPMAPALAMSPRPDDNAPAPTSPPKPTFQEMLCWQKLLSLYAKEQLIHREWREVECCVSSPKDWWRGDRIFGEWHPHTSTRFKEALPTLPAVVAVIDGILDSFMVELLFKRRANDALLLGKQTSSSALRLGLRRHENVVVVQIVIDYKTGTLIDPAT